MMKPERALLLPTNMQMMAPANEAIDEIMWLKKAPKINIVAMAMLATMYFLFL